MGCVDFLASDDENIFGAIFGKSEVNYILSHIILDIIGDLFRFLSSSKT